MGKRSTLVVAHGLSTLFRMNRIWILQDGKVVEDGSHEQLLDLGGHYSKMWKMQSHGFLPESPEA